ncbi:hypothetical protein IAU60_006406 [Kwoniella sp. DSM 27419]
MRLSTFLPLVALVAPVWGYDNSSSSSESLEGRTFWPVHGGGGGSGAPSTGGSYQTCSRVSGSFGWIRWDFGCLCSDDVEEYCRNNNIRSEIKNAIYSSINTYGVKSWFPHNAQPTCDGRGGYTCGSLGKKSDGSCGTTHCDNDHWTSSGGCCPRGQQYVGGKCCGSVGCSNRNGQCFPVFTCGSGQEYKDTQCCKTYQVESNGKCGCPWGQEDTGSACQPKCAHGQEYDDKTKKCVQKCDTANGWTHQKCKNNGPTLCCQRGWTAYNTACCAPGKAEVDSTGVCCTANVGAKVQNGQCIEPTSGPKHPHSRRSAGAQIQLTSSTAQPIPYGLEANVDGALCPRMLAACPIDPAAIEGEYECLDPMAEIQSCGGCATLGTGRDCTAIPGARWMGCNAGQCEVYSCRKGWKLRPDGSACERR